MTDVTGFCEYPRRAIGSGSDPAVTSVLGDIRGRGLGVVLACLVCQMGLGFGYVLGPLARDIIVELDWTRAMFSSARAPQLFVIAVASPLVGFLTVRFGARRILAPAAMLLGVSFLLLSRMQSLWHFSVVIMILGLAITGLGDITVGQVVSQWITRSRGLALGIVYTGSNIAGFGLTRIAAAVADRSSWREAFFWMGVAGFVILLPIAWMVVREAPKPIAVSATDGEAAGNAGDMDLSRALRTRTFWILLFSLFSFFFYFLGMLEHLVLFLTDEGMPRSEATAYFSNAIGLGLVSKVVLGLIADRIHHKIALLVDYALLALSSVLLLFLPHPTLLPVFILVFGFSVAARDVVYPLILTHCFGLRFMAAIYGALILALLPGGTLGPIYAAWVHDRFGSYDLAFQTFAVLNLLSVLALFFVRREFSRAGGGSV